ncbi:MAG: hypothetical protein AABZ08_04590 [Planctomycetota bacterium]
MISVLRLAVPVAFAIVQPGGAPMPDLQPTKLWRPFKITEQEEVRSIVRHRDGRLFTAGNTHSKAAGSHYWVGEISTDGKKLWGQSFVASNQERINDIALTYDQLLFIAGERYVGGYQGWLVKCSLDGRKIFEKTFGALGARGITTLSSIISAGQGCYILAGRSDSDAYLVKIDQSGKTLWEKRYGHYKDDWIIAGIPYREDHFLFASVCGEFNKFGQGKSKVWLFECDGSGKLLREFGTAGHISPGASAIATLGDRVFLGLSTTQFPERDYWVYELSSGLREKWKLQFGNEKMAFSTPSIYRLPNNQLLLSWTARNKLFIECLSDEGKRLADQVIDGAEGVYVPQDGQPPKLFLKEITMGP